MSSFNPLISRREALSRAGYGLGAMFVATALGGNNSVWAGPKEDAKSGPATKTHHAAKAKSIIHIFAGGGPSHLDTFDYKPELERLREKTLPRQSGVAFPSPFKFEKKGKSGLMMSEVFPKLGEVADEVCVIRSMYTDVPAHEPASKFMHTGNLQLTRPSVGSWTLYGLGSGNDSLPGFITLGGSNEWRQAAFLPSMYQGTRANYSRNASVEKVLLNLKNDFTGLDQQRTQLDLVKKLNAMHLDRVERDEQLESRIESFELAFKMQTEATDAFDIKKETQATRDRYGKSELAAKLLVARRLVERGVRFVQIDAGGWDNHQNLNTVLKKSAENIDGPAAALIADLKERGLLDSTLIVWGGEFGRTSTTAGRIEDGSGRDHHAECMSVWMAGGGVKGGYAHGATDELGQRVAEKPVHVHDLHATMMHLIGFDHTKLTYRYNGRDFRLTDNFGKVVTDVIA